MKDMNHVRHEDVGGMRMFYNASNELVHATSVCLLPQCDVLSEPADLQADDREVAALMMESDITAPIKEQCEENARLMREIDKLKHELDMADLKIKDLTAKVRIFTDGASLLVDLVNDLKA